MNRIIPSEILELLTRYEIHDYHIALDTFGGVQITLKGVTTVAPKRPYSEPLETMRIAVKQAVEGLQQAGQQLREQITTPNTPIPRHQPVEICPGWRWPAVMAPDQCELYCTSQLENANNWWPVGCTEFVDLLIEANKAVPTDVLKSIRKIKRATKWCRERMDGRERAAMNLLEETAQKKAYDRMLRERVVVEMAQ